MKYFNNESIKKIGEVYCGFKLKNVMTVANRVSYVSKNKGSGDGWHKDSYGKQFKSLLYLSNVNREDGAFQLIEKSGLFSIKSITATTGL